ncbi:MAG: Fic family protein [Methylobacteriaceae bacterium]|jgi:Fic family protein|nr:Fic family protein [Methylobacteriaceae bacterium]
MSKPPFSISEKTANLVGRIAEQIGMVHGSGAYGRNLHLRKINRLRSIRSSTAIEGNTLSLQQVTDVIEGRRVVGNPREIREVKNAYEAYERILSLDPFSVKDFLAAHKLMTAGLVEETGVFRSGDVGIFSGDRIVHLGARPGFVPKLVADLFEWAKHSETHPLIKSSVMHFEIEFIHPFADGNGRMGRLWQTLVLSGWYEIFAWLPVETIVYENQAEYYAVLGRAGKAADSSEFIEFMLDAVSSALSQLPTRKITDIITDKNTDKLSKTELEFLQGIIGFLENNGEINNFRAQLLTNKSADSVKKYFARLVEAGILTAHGANKARKYRLNKKRDD